MTHPRPRSIPRAQSGIARVMHSSPNSGVSHAAVKVPTRAALGQLFASGISHRIHQVRITRGAAPGSGTEPSQPMSLRTKFIVGVVDGELHASTYAVAE